MQQVARVLSPIDGGGATPNGTAVGGGHSAGKVHNNKEKKKLTITTSMTFQESSDKGEGLIDSDQSGALKKQKVCVIVAIFFKLNLLLRVCTIQPYSG